MHNEVTVNRIRVIRIAKSNIPLSAVGALAILFDGAISRNAYFQGKD